MILNEIIEKIRIDEQENFNSFAVDKFILKREREIFDPIPLLKKGFFLITEIKKASPSAGIIKKDFDPIKIAEDYQKAGASALSILTEKNYFLGSKKNLIEVGKNINIPILRKDFIIHPFQIYEAYNMGADIILLIAACLSSDKLSELYFFARDLGMQVLVEVHSEEELEMVLKIKPQIIGINNRDLKTFKTDLSVSMNLIKKVPEDIFVISESGIKNSEDITMLKKAGFSGALVGESLMRSKDLRGSVMEMINV